MGNFKNNYIYKKMLNFYKTVFLSMTLIGQFLLFAVKNEDNSQVYNGLGILFVSVMGNESKWWTWGMEGYDKELNLSIYTYSTYEVWNSTSQSIFTIENFTRLLSDDFLTSTTIQTSTTLTHNFIITVVVATILFIIILITIIGNVFVMSAILLERHLRNVGNYLIFSLAVADLLVAFLVMPLGALYEVSHKWQLGAVLCDLWTSIDVLSCTASILHLVAIGVDRYLAVTKVDYMHQRTEKLIGMMIFIVWLVSIFICIAPLFGWKDADREIRIVKYHTCLINQNASYQVFATISSFYLPSFVILILYWNIYQVARRRIRKRPGKTLNQGHLKSNDDSSKTIETGHAVGDALAQAQVSGGIAAAVVAVIGRPLPTVSETTTAFTTVSSKNASPEKTSCHNGVETHSPATEVSPKPRRKKVAPNSKRERKAAKTLVIITGAFVGCWLPFFVIALIRPFCDGCFNDHLFAFFQWLGYFNSTINPVIYTIFSPEFRHVFKKLLCRRRRNVPRKTIVRHNI